MPVQLVEAGAHERTQHARERLRGAMETCDRALFVVVDRKRQRRGYARKDESPTKALQRERGREQREAASYQEQHEPGVIASLSPS